MSVTVGFDISALDATFKEHAQRGIGRYVRELWRYFGSLHNHTGDVTISAFDHRDFTDNSILDRLIDSLPAGRHTVRQQLLYPVRLVTSGMKGVDVLHFPAHMDAPSWSIKNYVLTVLDLIPLVCADLYKADHPSWRFTFARWLELRAIKNAALIVAISQNTADDVHRILGIPYERIVVTPLGVDGRFRKQAEITLSDEAKCALQAKLSLPAQRPIILYVGGIDQRKNWRTLLETQSRLVTRAREKGTAAPLLVMAGRIEKDRQYPHLIALRDRLSLTHDVVMPGFIEDETLLSLYSLSSAFFFPSLYEGFGLPPLEAMAAGTPVVSSNTSAMPEVVGDGGILVNPMDVEAATKALSAVIENKMLANELREKGRKRAALFSWDRTGETTLAAYERLARERTSYRSTGNGH